MCSTNNILQWLLVLGLKECLVEFATQCALKVLQLLCDFASFTVKKWREYKCLYCSSKVIAYKSRGEKFLWNRIWNLGWFRAVGNTDFFFAVLLKYPNFVSFQNFRSLPFMSFLVVFENFFMKSQHSVLKLCHLTFFFFWIGKCPQLLIFLWLYTQFSPKNQANPEEVSTDSDSLAKILNLILNAL